MNRVLVTGASGFIGRALAARLRERAFEVVGIGSRDGDIASPGTLEALSGQSFSHAVHLAARTFVPDSWTNPLAFYETNVLGTANVLEFCKAKGVPLTYVSAYLYGQPDKLPIHEDCVARPNNPYAMSKWLAEKTCQFYADQHGVPVTVIRPFNVYGAGQDDRFLVPRIVKQALFADAINVKDLRPKRDYVYLDDLVEALVLSLDAPGGCRVCNIGSGVSLSVREVIDVVQSAVGSRKKIVCSDMTRPDEISDVVADISRAHDYFGWRPKCSFPDGIRSMVRLAQGGRHE